MATHSSVLAWRIPAWRDWGSERSRKGSVAADRQHRLELGERANADCADELLTELCPGSHFGRLRQQWSPAHHGRRADVDGSGLDGNLAPGIVAQGALFADLCERPRALYAG